MSDYKSMKAKYEEDVKPAWLKKEAYSSPMSVPQITKVVVNSGLGSMKENDKDIERFVGELKRITGQAPVVTTARKSVANFSVREGMKVGVKVTLRGKRKYHFLDKVFNYVLPRTRDFRGLSASGFDGNGNYTFGLEDQMVFLEIDPNKVMKRQGLQVTIVTNAKTDEEARTLLVELGLPLEKET